MTDFDRQLNVYRRAVMRVCADVVLERNLPALTTTGRELLAKTIRSFPDPAAWRPSIIRCATEIALAEPESDERQIADLVFAMIDSVQPLWLSGESIWLSVEKPYRAYLPHHALTVLLSGSATVKVGLTRAEVTIDGASSVVSSGSTAMETASDGLLVGPFDASYWDSPLCDFKDKVLLDLGPEHLDAFRLLIEDAMTMLRSADQRLAQNVVDAARWIVPISHSGERTRESFSTSTFPDVVFMSTNGPTIRVAEDLVHETCHLTLFQYEHLMGLLADSDTNLYYSPWRTDPRPASGLLYAIHAFTDVVRLFDAVLSKDGSTVVDRRYARTQRATNVARIAASVAQLRMRACPLSALGEMICDDALSVVGRDVRVHRNELSSRLDRHYRGWLETNGSDLRAVAPEKAIHYISELMG